MANTPNSNHHIVQIGRIIRARGKLEMSVYEKAVGSMKGTDAVIRMLDKLTIKRELQKGEYQHLKDAYLTKRWDHTNTKYDAFVLGIFTKALDGDAATKASWPVSDRFEDGIAKIKKGYKGVLHGLGLWIEKQKKLRKPNAAGDGGGAP